MITWKGPANGVRPVLPYLPYLIRSARFFLLIHGSELGPGGSPGYRRAFTDFWKWVGLVLLRRPGAFDQRLASFRSAGELSGYWKAGP